jgi:hypothetical protein
MCGPLSDLRRAIYEKYGLRPSVVRGHDNSASDSPDVAGRDFSALDDMGPVPRKFSAETVKKV